eukprot:1154930_1
MTTAASKEQPNEIDERQSELSNQTLAVHLNDKLVELNADQVIQIMGIITTNTTAICRDTDEANEDRIQSEYVLDANDTFLHALFGAINATKIKQIVEHKWMLVSLVLLGAVLVAVGVIFGDSNMVVNAYHITVVCLLMLPWLVLKHLLFNKVAFKLCLQSFDYWIKLWYGLIMRIMWFIPSMSLSNIIPRVIDVILIVLSISYIASLDAVHSTRTKKLMVSVLLAVTYSVLAIHSHIFPNDQNDYKIMIPSTNGMNVISTRSLVASSSRILSIFMWKQSYKAWKSTGRAIAISTAPRLTWIDTTGTAQKLDGTATKPVANNEMDSVMTQQLAAIDLRRRARNGENSQESSESKQIAI